MDPNPSDGKGKMELAYNSRPTIYLITAPSVYTIIFIADEYASST
jgi:hypothetical protein